jgi:hypothetical protein
MINAVLQLGDEALLVQNGNPNRLHCPHETALSWFLALSRGTRRTSARSIRRCIRVRVFIHHWQSLANTLIGATPVVHCLEETTSPSDATYRVFKSSPIQPRYELLSVRPKTFTAPTGISEVTKLYIARFESAPVIKLLLCLPASPSRRLLAHPIH